MKKAAIMLSIMSLLSVCTSAMKVQAVDTTPKSSIMIESRDGGQIMDTEVRVRVIADGVKIRKSPYPWAECLRVANKGENFKYTGHYLGYYLIYVGSEIFYISDNEKNTETYTVPIR